MTIAPAWLLSDQTAECCFIDRYVEGSAIMRLGAGRRIERVLLETTVIDQCESGGVIAGRSGHDWFDICATSGPGPSSERSCSHYRCDLDHDLREIERFRELGLRTLGDWHVHVGPAGFGVPSAVDLVCWAKRRRVLAVDRYLSVIVTGGVGDWWVDGFVVRAGAGDADVCERIVIH